MFRVRVAGNHGSNAVRSAGQGCWEHPWPADHHQLGAVDHGYPRSYGMYGRLPFGKALRDAM